MLRISLTSGDQVGNRQNQPANIPKKYIAQLRLNLQNGFPYFCLHVGSVFPQYFNRSRLR